MSVTQGKQKPENAEIKNIVNELRGITASSAAADRPLTTLEKIAMMAEAVQEAPLPSEPPKKGFKYQRYYDAAGGAIAWELVPDPDYAEPEGTFTNPIAFDDGMSVKEALWYTDGADVWQCIKSGKPSGFADREFFDVVT